MKEQNDSDEEDYERTCAMGILTLEDFKGFYISKK